MYIQPRTKSFLWGSDSYLIRSPEDLPLFNYSALLGVRCQPDCCPAGGNDAKCSTTHSPSCSLTVFRKRLNTKRILKMVIMFDETSELVRLSLQESRFHRVHMARNETASKLMRLVLPQLMQRRKGSTDKLRFKRPEPSCLNHLGGLIQPLQTARCKI